jgi:hypothetical protein
MKILTLILFVFITGCDSTTNKIKDSIVIQVNSSKLSLADFSDELSSELKSYDLITLKGTNYFELTKNKIIYY